MTKLPITMLSCGVVLFLLVASPKAALAQCDCSMYECGATCWSGEVCTIGLCVAGYVCVPNDGPGASCQPAPCIPNCPSEALCGDSDGCGGQCIGVCLNQNETCIVGVCQTLCGNNTVDGDEECDGTANCGANCKCMDGFGPNSAGQCVPKYTCSGFSAPFDVPLELKKNTNRTIPLKIELYHELTPVTDLDVSAPPVVNVSFIPDPSKGYDLEGQLAPPGMADDGNAFRWVNGFWMHNLGTKPWSSSGTYEVTVTPGDTGYLIVEPSCLGFFIRLQ